MDTGSWERLYLHMNPKSFDAKKLESLEFHENREIKAIQTKNKAQYILCWFYELSYPQWIMSVDVHDEVVDYTEHWAVLWNYS